MAILKRLLGAVVDGFGMRAGSRMLDEVVDGEDDKPEVKSEPSAKKPSADELRAEEQAILERRREAARKAEAEHRQKAEREKAEIDAELEALKKKLGK